MIVPTEGAFAVGAPVAVIKGAKNPNAARLFAQFMISTVAQRIVADNAMHSSRADIAPPKGQPALSTVPVMAIDFDRIERDAGDIRGAVQRDFSVADGCARARTPHRDPGRTALNQPASSAASNALAIASLLLPGLAASPMTVTIWPGRASGMKRSPVARRAR